MNIKPVAAGAARSVNPNEGRSASLDRVAAAKAVALGQTPAPGDRGPAPDPQVERAEQSIKRIKMRTQRSVHRHGSPELVQEATQTPPGAGVSAAEPTNSAQSDIVASTEPTEPPSDDNKPLSPQFAALAKGKRALELAQKEFTAQKAAYEAEKATQSTDFVSKADIKSNALKVLLDNGVTYDQLTEQILASNQETADLSALKAELKALKEGFESQNKSVSDKEAATEAQVKADIRRNVDRLIAQGDDYEMVREAGYAPKVVDLIDRVWKKEGVLLDEAEAASTIEKELLEESLKFARLSKVQKQLNPVPTPKAPVQTDRPGTKIMRTLTNRDGASSVSMSRKERAIAAMEGRLK